MIFDEKVRDVIHEYLMKRGLIRTVDTLLVLIKPG